MKILDYFSGLGKNLFWRLASATGFGDSMVHKGRVEIWRVDSSGEQEKIIDKENLVVDVGLNALRDAMQDSSNAVTIDKFAFGTGTTTPSAGDTSLESQVHEEAFDGYSDTATGESRFSGLLDSVEPSGQPYDISEFGVKLSDGTLWSRITFTAETKDSTQEWRVRYTSTWANA